jgi:hypothetical protein
LAFLTQFAMGCALVEMISAVAIRILLLSGGRRAG